jgi:hypothetical protein
MKEWKSLENRYERGKVCQIPDDVLPALSTEKLIELCLNYPFIIDIRAFDNILTGFDKYSGEFNGFQELIKRNDAALVLTKMYKEEDPLAIDKDWTLVEMIHYANKISMMELFLCNKQILSKLDSDEKRDLMNEYRLKKSQKNKMTDLYKNHDFQTIYLAMVKLLESENVDLSRDINMDNVTPYITTGILKSKEVFKDIINAVNNYLLNDLRPISEEFTYFEDHSQVLLLGQYVTKTPKGYTVLQATHPSETWSPEYRAAQDIIWLQPYTGAILINTYGGHSSTPMFNCHGYAWHVSERGLSDTAEYRLFGGEDIYWTDNGVNNSSYKQFSQQLTYPFPVGTLPPAYPGKVFYVSLNHSVVIANPDSFPPPPNNQQDVKVISKWANGPLVVHTPGNCPYSTNPMSLAVYHLNPILTGITSLLCNYDQRTFTTDITSLPAGALKWTHGTLITGVGADNAYQYTIRGLGAGATNSTFVQLETSTPSLYGSTRVRTWYGQKTFKVSKKPTISDQRVDGNTYQYGMGVRPGVGHWLTFVPYPNFESISDTWTVPSGIQYTIDQNQHRLGFYFLNNPSLTFTVKSTNTCGTGPVSSYYLTSQRGYVMTLYPNPASDNVTVTMTEYVPSAEYIDTTGFTSWAMTDTEVESVETTTYTIRIYNNQSDLLSTFTRSGGSFNIPLINMKDGAYIIEVSDGENYYRQQLIVKHN